MLMRTTALLSLNLMDRKPEEIFEVFLQPGEFYWGDSDTRIRTILGSCVAVTIWHPKKMIGGMCHIILPERYKSKQKSAESSIEKSAKYADEAIELMMLEMKRQKIRAADCHVKVFGGSNMFPGLQLNKRNNIGDRNLQSVLKQLDHHGFNIHANHYGGEDSRYIIFDIWSGYAWVKSKG